MIGEPLAEAGTRLSCRSCPFCGSDSSRAVGTRVDIWAKCTRCRSVFRDITPARFQLLHDEAFQDSEYIDTSNALIGSEPLGALWAGLDLPAGSVLEIGPGSGHLLAAARAAGCSVEAVESSAVHRDYIRDTWGIGTLYATMEEITDGRAFDAIVAINVFEHIYDIAAFLRAVRKVLAPGGTFYLSTPNALSLEATVLRSWWAMCKVHDHVSFPSSAGLALAARVSGLRTERVWSTGLPFEFPVSALIAARDRSRARRGPGQAAEPGEAATGLAPASGTVNPGAKSALARFYSAAAPFDPVYRLRGALGRAGSLKARLTR
jgi:2-polyprenyl-3-methyl-5-hydroxy-6-metoxy-1,4-benzoquinol methylase